VLKRLFLALSKAKARRARRTVQGHGPLTRAALRPQGGSARLAVSLINQADLKDMALTKDMAKLQSRQERIKRRENLLQQMPVC
jgi:hypothetical protein